MCRIVAKRSKLPTAVLDFFDRGTQGLTYYIVYHLIKSKFIFTIGKY